MSVTERIDQLGGLGDLVADVTAAVCADQRTDVEYQWAVTTAASLACKYAPRAPSAVLREAVRRCATWLLRKSVIYAETAGSAGHGGAPGITQRYAVHQFSALRHSGAMAILSPWKVRRAGAI